MGIVIKEHQAKTLGEKDLASTLDQVDSLSEEEAQRLLDESILRNEKK
jgi:hypothetical protein